MRQSRLSPLVYKRNAAKAFKVFGINPSNEKVVRTLGISCSDPTSLDLAHLPPHPAAIKSVREATLFYESSAAAASATPIAPKRNARKTSPPSNQNGTNEPLQTGTPEYVIHSPSTIRTRPTSTPLLRHTTSEPSVQIYF